MNKNDSKKEDKEMASTVQLRVDTEVHKLLKENRIIPQEPLNNVLRRKIGLNKNASKEEAK